MSAMPALRATVYARAAGDASLAILVALSFLASQRVLLTWVAAHLCIVPALMAVLAWRMPHRRNTLILLALFLSVDNGAGTYAETLPAVRYAIYALAAAAITDSRVFLISRLVGCGAFAAFYTALSLTTDHFSAGQFFADAILLFFVALAISASPAASTRVDLGLLNWCICGFVAGELLSLLLLPHTENHYLNYHSLKSLVVLPSLMLAIHGRLQYFAPAFAATMYLLLAYGTRMIVVAYLLVLAALAVRAIWHSPRRGRVTVAIAAFVATVLGASSAIDQATVESYKFGWMVSQLSQVRVNTEVLQLIDPVRFGEHGMFFDRNWVRILVGEGLGSGLYDHDARLDFIGAINTAFTDEELASRVFFNFHDFWIDVGVRFGLLAVVTALAVVVRMVFAHDEALSLVVGVLFVLVLCAFFSTAGVLVIALLILDVRRRRHDAAAGAGGSRVHA